MYAYLLFSIKNPAYLPEIHSFIASASSLLPPGFSTAPVVVQPSDEYLLCYWAAPYAAHHAKNVNPGHTECPNGTFFCSNYAARDILGPENGISKISKVNSGQLSFDQSPGGVAAWVWIAADAKSAMSWSTVPSAITTFISKNRDGFCVSGNRPRFTYAASTLSTGYRPASDYLPKYISSAFAFDGETPYPNTVALQPSTAALLQNGCYSAVNHPTPRIDNIPQTRSLEEKSEALAQLLRGACWVAQVTPASLFLSGGKDSRTISSAFRGLGIDGVTAFTFGNDTTGEGETASLVAGEAGFSFTYKTQRIVTDPLKALTNALKHSDGLGTSFAHQYHYDSDLSFTAARSSFHGHGHLLRGGFARTMKQDGDYIEKFIRSAFISPYVTRHASETTTRALNEYLQKKLPAIAREPLDNLFLSNRDYRLGLFSAPSALELTSKTMMCYPLLDERIAQFAAALSVYDRISERVVFGAITKLAPSVADIPLFGEIWRFDRDHGRTNFVDSDHNFDAGYEKRVPQQANKFTHLTTPQSALQRDADNFPAVERKRQIAELVMDSRVWADVRPCLTADLQAEISLRALGRPSDLSGKGHNEQFAINAFLDRVGVAAAIYDIRW
ncbi:hypothetical protein FHT98_0418 [Bosea sp. AK1]|uniref:hypothetical protein n=1 Tax=Bosea sp. AK1 TaxID=2587160 RepID=UPI00115071F2|nr:hypothetical protein [Bosea sp. AK1]TQI72706.1 hypothetical protein FHT98_0418 [Bosea sp. AK1]